MSRGITSLAQHVDVALKEPLANAVLYLKDIYPNWILCCERQASISVKLGWIRMGKFQLPMLFGQEAARVNLLSGSLDFV